MFAYVFQQATVSLRHGHNLSAPELYESTVFPHTQCRHDLKILLVLLLRLIFLEELAICIFDTQSNIYRMGLGTHNRGLLVALFGHRQQIIYIISDDLSSRGGRIIF